MLCGAILNVVMSIQQLFQNGVFKTDKRCVSKSGSDPGEADLSFPASKLIHQGWGLRDVIAKFALVRSRPIRTSYPRRTRRLLLPPPPTKDSH